MNFPPPPKSLTTILIDPTRGSNSQLCDRPGASVTSEILREIVVCSFRVVSSFAYLPCYLCSSIRAQLQAGQLENSSLGHCNSPLRNQSLYATPVDSQPFYWIILNLNVYPNKHHFFQSYTSQNFHSYERIILCRMKKDRRVHVCRKNQQHKTTLRVA